MSDVTGYHASIAPKGSIQTRLLAYGGLYLALLVGLSLFAIVQISAVRGLAGTVSQTSLPGTRILAELSSRLAAHQHAETMLSYGEGENMQHEADALMTETHEALGRLTTQFAQLPLSERVQRLFGDFNETLTAYLAGHDRLASGQGASESHDTGDAHAGHGGHGPGVAMRNADTDRHQALYTATERALTELTLASAETWSQGAIAAEDKAAWMQRLFIAMFAASLVFAGWLALEVRKRIAHPIAAITGALSALAAGDTEVVVPGADRTDEIGVLAKALEVFRRNVSALRKAHQETEEAQRRAEILARHDALTGLPNRRVFAGELEDAIGSSGDPNTVQAVLLLDLDRFKPVNDSHGHSVGDAVLCEIADRLRAVVGSEAVVARLGGDEFAAIVAFQASRERATGEVMKLADLLIRAISEPIFVGGLRVEVGVSVGIAFCPTDGRDAETLLRAADIAMYRAKQEGRGVFRFFEAAMDSELMARAQLEADLREALTTGNIVPYYQPVVAITDGTLLGFEVLARWHHEEKGVLAPAAFIPFAEETGIIRDLTFAILRRACLDATNWPEHLTLAINLSPVQLQDELLPTRVMAALSETGFPPRRLELEITETSLVADVETAKSIIATLQGLGIKVILDDFGTGYSGFYHLRELRLDKIKIDRSFVQSMRENLESEKIVHAILGLTKSLGLPTVAEGIEDAELRQLMIESGCELGQGYYFGKPMPAHEANMAVLAGSLPDGKSGPVRKKLGADR